MRHRERTIGGFDTELTEREIYIPTGDTIGTTTTFVGTRDFKSIDDNPLSNFAFLRKCGKFLPPTGVEIRHSVETRTPFDLDVTNDVTTRMLGPFYMRAGDLVSVPSGDGWLASSVVNQAAARAASARWDVLTFLAELRESVETIAEIGKRFNHLTETMAVEASYFRRNPWTRFRQLWLGSRFGVRPMMYDARDAALAIFDSKAAEKFTRGSAHATMDINEVATTTYDFYGRWIMRQDESLVGKRTYRGLAYCKADLMVGPDIGADPLVTAWELVPYSFVVDWFIGIGDYVTSIRPRLLGEYLGIQSSEKLEYVHQQTLSLEHFATGWRGSIGKCITKTVVRNYTRAPASVSLPVPNVDLNLPKIVDLAALFIKGRSKVFQILSRAAKRKHS